MEEKLSLKPISYTPKRFHRIHSQIRMGLTSTFISNTHFIGKRCLSTISTPSEIEPVLIYTNPDEQKTLKQGLYVLTQPNSGQLLKV